jgi:hypothetical protein
VKFSHKAITKRLLKISKHVDKMYDAVSDIDCALEDLVADLDDMKAEKAAEKENE